jgi:dTDP-4-dehydrorhamnose 3,5-epimerase
MINDVVVNKLTTFKDERGYFREIWRFAEEKYGSEFNEGKAQLSHSLASQGVIKGWHGHVWQSQLNYVASGDLKVVLLDNRKDSSTYKQFQELHINDNTRLVYYFPKGVLHGYECIKGPMNIIYFTSGSYDLNDEVRISRDDFSSIYKW